MNLIIILIGSAVMTGLITMLTVDLLEDNGEQERTAKLEREITYLNQDFEAKHKKKIVFLNLGKE